MRAFLFHTFSNRLQRPPNGNRRPVHLEAVNAAVQLARPTRESTHEFHVRCRESLQIGGILQALLDRSRASKSYPKSSEQLRVGWDHDWASDAMGERISDRPVQSHPSLQEYLLADRALPFDFREVVFGDCVYQPRKNVVVPLALLLGDANVGIDERRASRLEFHRRRSSQCDVGDLRHTDPEITWALSSRKEPVPAEQALFIA